MWWAGGLVVVGGGLDGDKDAESWYEDECMERDLGEKRRRERGSIVEGKKGRGVRK